LNFSINSEFVSLALVSLFFLNLKIIVILIEENKLKALDYLLQIVVKETVKELCVRELKKLFINQCIKK